MESSHQGKDGRGKRKRGFMQVRWRLAHTWNPGFQIGVSGEARMGLSALCTVRLTYLHGKSGEWNSCMQAIAIRKAVSHRCD